MGFYERRVFPWLNDRLNRDPELVRLRREALAPARGRVLEIGFGTGANLPHYPDGVTAVVAVEPSEGMNARAARAIAASRIPVDSIATGAENLPVPDRSVDTVVSTLVLCTVDDPARVLNQIHRVLRDEGRFVLLEHGLSNEPHIARWQHRLNGVQRIVACGCNLDRRIRDLVETAGFRFDEIRQFYAPKIPKTHGWITTGVARPS
jgi:SAM-dependent methyltransferase